MRCPRWNHREHRYWSGGLAALALVCCLGTSYVFTPGYMSTDSLYQLGQALGVRPMTDWHPPVLALVWKGLIALTGTPAAMAVLQAAVLWGALWVIAWCVWDRTGSRPGSLAVLGIGLAPHILTFTGVVWKDVHMAFALLAACAVALVAQRLPAGRSRTRWALFGLGVLFIAYAVLVRKNALLAGVPVFAMLTLALWPKPGRRRWLLTSAALTAVVVASSAAVSAATTPLRTSQYAQIMVDDLVHVLSPNEVRTAAGKVATTQDFQSNLTATAERCTAAHQLSDAYIRCYPGIRQAPPTELASHADEVTSMWLNEIPGRFPAYARYRLELFTKFLFQGGLQFQDGLQSNTYDLREPSVPLKGALRFYVLGMARDLPLLFAGWFWLAVALVLALRPGRGAYAVPVRALGISAALYVLGYLPTVPATDFRYLYWPALAGTLGLLLAWLQRRPARHDRHDRHDRHETAAQGEQAPAAPDLLTQQRSFQDQR
jgi:uncharacterized membrane protein